MTARRTYLDWNASAPLRPSARDAMLAALDVVGNPSSVHREGRAARRIVEDARDAVATLAGTNPRNVVFTSGATEANVWVHGHAWTAIAHCRIEHASVLGPIDVSKAERVVVPATRDGRIDVTQLDRQLSARAEGLATARGRALLTLQAASNETGVIQPLAEAVALARSHHMLVASDAVQAAGRVPLDFDGSGIAYMTLSAHKLGGPKGVGALIVRPDAPLPPLLVGGGQERRLRAGTENITGIAGFGVAAREAAAEAGRIDHVSRMRDQLEADVIARIPGARIIGAAAPRLPNTSAIAIPQRPAETLVAALDLAGVAVSAGAACSSGKVAESHVLAAMGYGLDITRHTIRVSLGPTTTDEDVAAFVAALTSITRAIAHAA